MNAESGELICKFGKPGSDKGEFQRPNRIAVIDDWLLVVERDNRRVQVFHLPDFTSYGFFGEQHLKKPYGIAIYQQKPDIFSVYVTDNYDTSSDHTPPDSELGERVKVFQLELRNGYVHTKFLNFFGDTEGNGILHKVESIALDETSNES
jgi:3-phytase